METEEDEAEGRGVFGDDSVWDEWDVDTERYSLLAERDGWGLEELGISAAVVDDERGLSSPSSSSLGERRDESRHGGHKFGAL